MIGLASAAGVFAIGSGVLLWLGHRNAEYAREIRVGAVPLAGGGAIALDGRF
jgi:hypothetical protein